MNVKTTQSKNAAKKRHRYLIDFCVLVIIVVLVGALVAWKIPESALSATTTLSVQQNASVILPWPAFGQAAIGALGYGVLASKGPQTALPTASVAKLITALAVLQKYPLSLGQQGPTLILEAPDVASYQKYQDEDGSVIQVVAGEQITEYQMLEAMLLPSANNIADSLATWAYGSLPAYTTAANTLVAAMGLTKTVIGSDASGFLPSTVSSPHDLVLLGESVLSNPVLAQIVGLQQATVPVAGVVKNVNWLLGQDGIIGVKTGNTSQAGGVYLFAAKYTTSNTSTVTLIGSIMGAPTLQAALNATPALLTASEKNFQYDTVIKSGQTVGYYKVPWSNQIIPVVASQNVTVLAWAGTPPKPQISFYPLYPPLSTTQKVGVVSLFTSNSEQSSTLTLNAPLGNSPWYWPVYRFIKD